MTGSTQERPTPKWIEAQRKAALTAPDDAATARRWKCAKPYRDQGIWYIDEADGLGPTYGFIATVSDVDGQAESNAHLIASAPELHAALREMVEFAGNASPDLLKRAEAVLARAEGPLP